jgi:hypothetical protein
VDEAFGKRSRGGCSKFKLWCTAHEFQVIALLYLITFDYCKLHLSLF